MARINTPVAPIHTHEGAKAQHINAEQQLRRSVMSCMLWESEFYEDGQTIATRIADCVAKVAPEKVAAIAVEAREKMKLRHAPLLIVREMARLPRHKALVADTLATVIQRADELAEFLAIYWKDGKQPLSKQVKTGLARAFTKFSAYDLAKYNRYGAVKLRDVLFLCHANPKDDEQAETWKQLIENTLPIPDTWEVNLSAGKDKKETWERLLAEKKLGALALLRNLRNMAGVGVNEAMVFQALDEMKVDRVLPFRFIAAARFVPQWEPALERAFLRCASGALDGKTALLVDVSGSMDVPLSEKSDMRRIDAACGVAMVAREMGDCRVFTFSAGLVEVPARHGFALRDAIQNSQQHDSTRLGAAVAYLNQNIVCDRLIVITDEQSHDRVSAPTGKGYMINVASGRNGVGYGAWTHIDGFSEAVLDYIRTTELQDTQMSPL